MRIAILFTALLAPIALISQPVIDISWSPKIGDEWKQSITNELPDVSPIGGDQTWDFSEVSLSTDPTVIFSWTDPSSGENSECYENATIMADLAIVGYGDGISFGFYEQDQTSFKVWGESSVFGSKTLYSNPIDFRYIGLQFGELISDEYAGVSSVNGFDTRIGGQTSYSYDAHGTVILPQGSFNNVIRINQLDVSKDSFEVGAVLDITLDSLHSIAFMAEGSIFPIALWQRNVSYTKSYINGILLGSVFNGETLTFSINPDYGLNTALETNFIEKEINLYPSIASTYIMLENANSHGNILITSGLGVVVDEMVISNAQTIIDISTLENGHYFILDSNGSLLDRFIKQE